MQTIFVINPAAGKGQDVAVFTAAIYDTARALGKEVTVYHTKAVRDAEHFVKEYCAKNGAARFIACGGDGTLSEVLNGAAACPDAEIGVMPFGSGNDFCRNFTDCGDFKDIRAQLLGKTQLCDAIEYKTEISGKEKRGLCANMFNIGFDCNVADEMACFKRKPFVSGSMAYLLAIFKVLIQKKTANLAVELDGKLFHTGPLLLSAIANGSYCGGGIKSNPLASICDGYLSTNIIYNVTRCRLISLLPLYMKGTHVDKKGIERFIYSTKCKQIVITPNESSFRICVDGEVMDAGKTEFNILPKAFRFVVPKKA